MMAMVEAPFYTIPASAWSVKKYGTIFNSSEQLASNLDLLLLPGETFYEWGSESGRISPASASRHQVFCSRSTWFAALLQKYFRSA
jgi:hypothetical protein